LNHWAVYGKRTGAASLHHTSISGFSLKKRAPMKQLFPCLLFLLLALPGFCQDRLVSGVLTADDGSPLPGVNVVVKGTANGATSDAGGRYVIRAPLGATLVFSFIGFASSEVVVTLRNSSPVGGQASPAAPAGTPRKMHPAAPVQDTVVNRRGVASLANPSPGYVQKSAPNPPWCRPRE
jgi:hypothetical protein